MAWLPHAAACMSCELLSPAAAIHGWNMVAVGASADRACSLKCDATNTESCDMPDVADPAADVCVCKDGYDGKTCDRALAGERHAAL